MTARLHALTNSDPSTWPATASGLSTRTCSCGTMFHVEPTSAARKCRACSAPMAASICAAVRRILARSGFGWMTVTGSRCGCLYHVDVTREDESGIPGRTFPYSDDNWRQLLRDVRDDFADANPRAVTEYWQGRRDAWALADERAAIGAAGEVTEGESRP